MAAIGATALVSAAWAVVAVLWLGAYDSAGSGSLYRGWEWDVLSQWLRPSWGLSLAAAGIVAGVVAAILGVQGMLWGARSSRTSLLFGCVGGAALAIGIALPLLENLTQGFVPDTEAWVVCGIAMVGPAVVVLVDAYALLFEPRHARFERRRVGLLLRLDWPPDMERALFAAKWLAVVDVALGLVLMVALGLAAIRETGLLPWTQLATGLGSAMGASLLAVGGFVQRSGVMRAAREVTRGVRLALVAGFVVLVGTLLDLAHRLWFDGSSTLPSDGLLALLVGIGPLAINGTVWLRHRPGFEMLARHPGGA